MDFFTALYVWGNVFAAQAPRPEALPFVEEWHETGSADTAWAWAERWDADGPARLVKTHISRNPSTGQITESASEHFDLNPDGTLRAYGKGKDEDFRESGTEFIYSGGRLAKVVDWVLGTIRDSVVYAYSAGKIDSGVGFGHKPPRNWYFDYTPVSGTNRLDRERIGMAPGFSIRDWIYSPLQDTVRKSAWHGATQPADSFNEWVLKNGRLASARYFQDSSVFAYSVYRYGTGSALAPRRSPARGTPNAIGRDIIGRKIIPDAGDANRFPAKYRVQFHKK